jgi:hypothetical protein
MFVTLGCVAVCLIVLIAVVVIRRRRKEEAARSLSDSLEFDEGLLFTTGYPAERDEQGAILVSNPAYSGASTIQ